jgi:hypothetical protein
MNIEVISDISSIDKNQWNLLVTDNNPFLRHEFLHALEAHHCVGETFGWLPTHIAIYQDEKLIGAMPLYKKYNSYGEFVFDHSWADAYQRAGLKYFPKLVSAIPYTPASGKRLLCMPGFEDQVYPQLLQSAITLAQQQHLSSLHILFPTYDENQWLGSQGLLTRYDCQFHWHNDHYQTFDDFLGKLSSRKRKKIKQERRYVKESGVTLRVLDGHSATEQDWDHFFCFYQEVFNEKWGIATLNGEFFKTVAKDIPDQVVLVLADHQDRCVAGALMYRSDTTLYGRHWGSTEHFHSLHFEACYYQGIEYCIQHGLQTFEPGAQGEHKIARGFVPTLTRSSHWLANSPFSEAIAQFVKDERVAINEYIEDLNQRLPYKS